MSDNIPSTPDLEYTPHGENWLKDLLRIEMVNAMGAVMYELNMRHFRIYAEYILPNVFDLLDGYNDLPALPVDCAPSALFFRLQLLVILIDICYMINEIGATIFY